MLLLQTTSTSSLGETNWVSISIFFAFVALTMYITWWASRKTKTTSEFYAAGRSISGFQNGLALAGDYMSAASFLGIAGLVATLGFDGLLYSIGFIVGWPLIMFLIAEPLRNLGKYTFADVVAFRLKQKPIRIASAIGSILTILFYLIAQMVGAGGLVETLFGVDYTWAVIVVGIVMMCYVLFGGMLATTWVQIIKAVLLLGGATVLVFLALWKFDFSIGNLFQSVSEKYGQESLGPGKYFANPLDAISLGLALMLGTAGLPHILMRFYTVPDAKQARKSVFVATGFIGYFYLLTFVIGFAAAAIVGREAIMKFDAQGNMSAILLSEALGGKFFLGFIAAVAFATILAVVAGLTLSGASSIAHDLYVHVFRNGESNEKGEVKVAKYSTIALGILAILLGLIFKGQNVAFMVGLAFAIAASANFPSLILSILWKKFTTQGAVWSIVVGATSAIVLIILSPTVWEKVLHLKDAPFPLKNPALVSITLSVLSGVIVSLLKPEKEAQEKFEKEKIRTYLGVGAE